MMGFAKILKANEPRNGSIRITVGEARPGRNPRKGKSQLCVPERGELDCAPMLCSPPSGTMSSYARSVGSALKRLHPRLFILRRFAASERQLIYCAVFCVALLLLPAGICAQPRAAADASRIDMREFGAAADGRTLDTAKINKAIETLAKQGGGTVVFPRGTYLTGAIYLLSNITLQLDAGATILGSTDIKQYPRNEQPCPGSIEWGRYALITARGQANVAIIGQGTINGQGSSPQFTKKDMIAAGMTPNDAYLNRPFGLSFVECKHVIVRDIHLKDIAMWCEDYLGCDDVSVSGVTVDSMKEDYNNDGIDIDSCRNVRVSDCDFFAGDDAICLKATYRDCENITVTNCAGSSLANGIKFGTASHGGFKNISISNCAIYNTNCAGIALEIADGGTLDHVAISNIAMRNVGTAIFVRLANRARKWGGPVALPPGVLRNVSISNITADIWPKPRDTRPFACSILGLPGHPIENISISNVRLVTRYEVSADKARRLVAQPVPENETHYPEFSDFGDLPASGFYIRHARNISFSNLSAISTTADHRSIIAAEDVDRLRVDGFDATHTAGALPAFMLKDVRHARLTRIDMPEMTTPVLLQREGCTDILLDANLPKGVNAITRDLNTAPASKSQ